MGANTTPVWIAIRMRSKQGKTWRCRKLVFIFMASQGWDAALHKRKKCRKLFDAHLSGEDGRLKEMGGFSSVETVKYFWFEVKNDVTSCDDLEKRIRN